MENHDWILSQQLEDLREGGLGTPRRALADFFQVATPVDNSPDPTELAHLGNGSNHIIVEATPSGSQQPGSQRNGTKRKLAEEQRQDQSSSSKRPNQEAYDEAEDILKSILNETEMASDLGSPDVVMPRLSQREKKRVSVTPFMQVLSQESQPSQPPIDEEDDTGDFPSQLEALEAPPMARRPNSQPKKKVSMSTFQGPLAAQAMEEEQDGEDEESSQISELESPDLAGLRRPALRSKGRVSTSVFKEAFVTIPADMLAEEDFLDGSSLPDLPEAGQGPQRPGLDRQKSRVSSSAFKAALETQGALTVADQSDSNDSSLPPSIDSPGEVASQRPVPKSKSRVSTSAFKAALEVQIVAQDVPAEQPPSVIPPAEAAEPKRKSRASTSAFKAALEVQTAAQDVPADPPAEPKRKSRASTSAPEARDVPEDVPAHQSLVKNRASTSVAPTVADQPSSNGSSGGVKTRTSTSALEASNAANQRGNVSTRRSGPKSRTSVVEEDLSSDSSLPSSIETPGEAQRAGPKSSRKRPSSTAFKEALVEKAPEVLDISSDSLESTHSSIDGPPDASAPPADGSSLGPSTLETPEPQVRLERPGRKPKEGRRYSTTAYENLLAGLAPSQPTEGRPDEDEDDDQAPPATQVVEETPLKASQATPATPKRPVSMSLRESAVIAESPESEEPPALTPRRTRSSAGKSSTVVEEATTSTNSRRRSSRVTEQQGRPPSTEPEASANRSQRRTASLAPLPEEPHRSSVAAGQFQSSDPEPRPPSSAGGPFKRVVAESRDLDTSASLEPSRMDLDEFSKTPLASSTQVMPRRTGSPSLSPGSQPESVELGEGGQEPEGSPGSPQTVLFSQPAQGDDDKGSASSSSSDSVSLSDLPPELATPVVPEKLSRRPERAASLAMDRKDRASMTEYLNALKGKEATPPKAPKTPVRTTPKRNVSAAENIRTAEKAREADAAGSSGGGNASLNRTRKSLNFPTAEEIRKHIVTIVDIPADAEEPFIPEVDLADDDVVEETPSSPEGPGPEEDQPEVLAAPMDVDGVPDAQEEEEEEEEEEEGDEAMEEDVPTRPSAGTSARVKNSTILADGAPFTGAPLPMSPISFGSNPPGTVRSTPSTPPRSIRKKKIQQSPMFLSVVQKNMLKASAASSAASSATSSAAKPPASASSTPSGRPSLVAPKGTSRPNPTKGKSVASFQPVLEETSDDASSETEWEDAEEDARPDFDVSRIVKVAFMDVKDRRKDFPPLEQRLRADPEFQAKVKYQRAKNAAEKAVQEAAALEAKKKLAAERAKTRATRKKATKTDDNVADPGTNKNNFKFFARSKVTKEALDTVHDLMGTWLDFTLDQMETFCRDEGKPCLESWEDIMKMLKRQGVVKNYWEYSGLCHELLTHDESARMLPQGFPPGHEQAKLEAKRKEKRGGGS